MYKKGDSTYTVDLENYIKPDGEVIKCFHCNSDSIYETNHTTEDDYVVVEFDVLCLKCKRDVAQWSFGYWYYKGLDK